MRSLAASEGGSVAAAKPRGQSWGERSDALRCDVGAHVTPGAPDVSIPRGIPRTRAVVGRYSDRSVSELNLILFGPPGAGKGTQAERLQADFQLPYTATGDILRENVREGTELGRQAERYMNAGDLVPDDVIIAMVTERLQEEDARDGFILDGFPRTIEQADALDRQLSELGRRITAVLLLDVPDEEVVRRLSGRRVCVKSGHNYHVEFDPPKREGVCDQDGSRLIQRDDDNPAVVQKRVRVYHEQTEPLVEYYDQKGILRRVDGTRGPAEVHDHIRAVIATLRLEENV